MTKVSLVYFAAVFLSLLSFSCVSLALTKEQKDAYIIDSSGKHFRDSNHNCVRSSSWTPGASIANCEEEGRSKLKEKIIYRKLVISASTFFDTASHTIRKSSYKVLDSLVDFIFKKIKLKAVVVTGYTDDRGSDEFNLKLSQDRADSVSSYIADKGIKDSYIRAEGRCKSDPIGDNRTKDGRAKNRRVEIEVIGTTSSGAPDVGRSMFVDDDNTRDYMSDSSSSKLMVLHKKRGSGKAYAICNKRRHNTVSSPISKTAAHSATSIQ
ncbi:MULTISPECIES: OmpA family protein [Candidatus Ichthyocystis]|uniref:OmpA family protein n=1 Tax=Candidatus Ichthyocystis TaxID=2929841 RepID=UPI000B8365C0|nr:MULTISPECIES: OmpA family protein [Ichthyocystis]